jgi:hypothetical protein
MRAVAPEQAYFPGPDWTDLDGLEGVVRPGGDLYTRRLMAYRIEFDPVNKILLFRFEGRLSDESLAESYRVIRKYSTATDAGAGILDLSLVTEFAVSAEFIRQLANQEPAMADATRRPRVIVASGTVGFGLSRMFQQIGENTRPLLSVVPSLEEALEVLRVQSPQFEPLK